jgi:hypothetical protein
MTEAMGFKNLHRGPLEWNYLRTKFHKNLPSSSEVISGGTQTERRTDGQIDSLLSFLESRLKNTYEYYIASILISGNWSRRVYHNTILR